MTEAGLNTYNLSQMNTVQQIMLFTQIIIGSAIFVSIWVVQVRKRAFENRFGDLLAAQKVERRERRLSGLVAGGRVRGEMVVGGGDDAARDGSAVEDGTESHQVSSSTEAGADAYTERGAGSQGADHIRFVEDDNRPGSTVSRKRHPRLFNFTGVGAAPVNTLLRRPGQGKTHSTHSTDFDTLSNTTTKTGPRDIMGAEGAGRNSQFHGLTREERDRLGGVEYRSIELLSWIVPIYFILWQLLGCLGLGAWMAYHARDITEANGINPWWNGAFNAVSAFNNSGMSLLDANMLPFQTSTYPVITMGLLILAGNTAYPIFLRFILWTMLKILPSKPKFEELRETLTFVLNHPRRVYTNLFPSRPTWWLFMTVVTLNATDWVFFELLNIGNSIVESIPTGSRILDGLFQALAVRSGGFYIVPIAQIRIGVQVLYVVMMYISVYPVAITTRSSNVYEERSLGIYADDHSYENAEDRASRLIAEKSNTFSRLRRTMTSKSIKPSETRTYFVRQQMRGQLEHDLSWLVIAIFIITCIEASSFERDPVVYSVFNIIFEVVSGYGCVGISTGLSDQAYSFSGGWHTVSKLVLAAVMLRGRHRGLPVALDRAVLLPGDGEREGIREEEDHELRIGMGMRGRSLSTSDLPDRPGESLKVG